jgi:hypothetical protein
MGEKLFGQQLCTNGLSLSMGIIGIHWAKKKGPKIFKSLAQMNK